MKQMDQTVRNEKQRKFLLIFPALAVPLITLLFWSLGGGKGSVSSANAASKNGLNLKLPDARLKDDKGLDKLSFYQQASLQAQKALDEAKSDPYWDKNETDSGAVSNGLMYNDHNINTNRQKVYDKLDELKAALNKTDGNRTENRERNYSHTSHNHSADADRLQAMMRQMKEDKSEDPEMAQLNEMLDKIQAIQNQDKSINAKPSATDRLSVKMKEANADISLLQTNKNVVSIRDTVIKTQEHNGFYGMDDVKSISDSIDNNAIDCTIPETQTIVAGSTVKLALGSDVTISEMSLPSGTSVYGTASMSNERLVINIKSIRYQNTILPVSLSVYDMDGQEGIFVPGSINRTVAKESANKTISGVDATLVDPSLGAQAASAGIETAKTLIGKKVKLIKVTVPSGYKVLLRNTKEQ